MQALAAGFTNIEDVRIEVRNNEYVGLIRQYGWLYHSGINADSMESARVAVVLSRRNALLRDALIGHLQQGDRLFVRKTNLPHTEGEINDLVAAMGLYGPATLLWIVPTAGGRQPGTVEWIGPRLLRGHIDRFAPYDDAHNLSLECWLAICRAAYRLWRTARPQAPATRGPLVSAQSAHLYFDLLRGRLQLSRPNGPLVTGAALASRMQVSRGSCATWIDDGGWMQLAEPHTPRFDHNASGAPLGLLVEPAAANLFPESDEVTAGWASSNGAHHEPSREVPPLRYRAAVLRHWRGQAGSSEPVFHHFLPSGMIAGKMYCVSAWVWVPREFRGFSVGIGFNGFAAVSSVAADLARTECWQRIWCTSRVPGTLSVADPSMFIGGSAGETVFSTCWQMEEGALPSSYIPSTRASGTRDADTIFSDRPILPWPSAAADTLVWEGSFPEIPSIECDIMRLFGTAQQSDVLSITAGPSLGVRARQGEELIQISGWPLVGKDRIVRVVVVFDSDRLTYADSGGFVQEERLPAISGRFRSLELTASLPAHHRAILLFEAGGADIARLSDVGQSLATVVRECVGSSARR
jgi:hypothetical protein